MDTPQTDDLRDGTPLERALTAALAWHPSENGQSYRKARKAVFDAVTYGLRAAVEAEREACFSVVKKMRYGPPSMWGAKNPPRWHLPEPCSPRDASMHDNGINDALVAIRARGDR